MTASLTERQLQVLSLVSHGFSNERIGERLGISTLAARNHVYKILVKLDVSDAPHAVRIGFEDGLLTKSEARAPRVVRQRGGRR